MDLLTDWDWAETAERRAESDPIPIATEPAAPLTVATGDVEPTSVREKPNGASRHPSPASSALSADSGPVFRRRLLRTVLVVTGVGLLPVLAGGLLVVRRQAGKSHSVQARISK